MQLEFVANYTESIPTNERIVLPMHIPLTGRDAHQVPERAALFEILARHPHTLSISAHLHMQGHFFLGIEEGNPGAIHHHWNSPTASGSWWRGRRDPGNGATLGVDGKGPGKRPSLRTGAGRRRGTSRQRRICAARCVPLHPPLEGRPARRPPPAGQSLDRSGEHRDVRRARYRAQDHPHRAGRIVSQSYGLQYNPQGDGRTAAAAGGAGYSTSTDRFGAVSRSGLSWSSTRAGSRRVFPATSAVLTTINCER